MTITWYQRHPFAVSCSGTDFTTMMLAWVENNMLDPMTLCSQQCCWGHVVMLSLCRDLKMLHSEYWKTCLKQLTCSCFFFLWRQMHAVLSPGITWQEEDCSSWTGFTRRHMHRATLVLVFLQASRQYKTCLRVWTILIHMMHPCLPPLRLLGRKIMKKQIRGIPAYRTLSFNIQSLDCPFSLLKEMWWNRTLGRWVYCWLSFRRRGGWWVKLWQPRQIQRSQ